ncbi:23S rRNA pseudouridine2457 synthase [Chitinasiproducens palmae]|uniref:Pseudouridine synthase n=1 Tax=Chitinasiproducens palmae TaxID=1770053 RepID=A0A1H2PR68_9BURK|nr:23S rRNA pseudouridine2457 synthase [Chitinasiproducens palmae]
MARLIALNKPFDVICQFSAHPTRRTLADCIPVPQVYPAGRLDADSEGLLLLTDDGALQAQISAPRHKLPKRYLAQVEGLPGADALAHLRAGIDLGDYRTQPCQARVIDPPDLWPRNPPIRYRAAIPTTWLELIISEGKNRQVRRMTAAVGLPTLRLVRRAVGDVDLFDLGLAPGEWRELDVGAPWRDERPVTRAQPRRPFRASGETAPARTARPTGARGTPRAPGAQQRAASDDTRAPRQRGTRKKSTKF